VLELLEDRKVGAGTYSRFLMVIDGVINVYLLVVYCLSFELNGLFVEG